MPLPHVAYAPSRLSFNWDTTPHGGNWYGDYGWGAVMKEMADQLATLGWERTDTLYASGSMLFTYGFPVWSGDPDEQFIIFGNILWHDVDGGGRTIHFVTPYQLAHDPPVYEGVYIVVAGISQEESTALVLAACNELWPDFTWTATDREAGGKYLNFAAKIPGPQWNDWVIQGNGAWSDAWALAKNGGLTLTSPASSESETSRVVLTLAEFQSMPNLRIRSELWDAGTYWPLAWHARWTVTANPYQIAIFCRAEADNDFTMGDGNQYNSFFFASAPYIEETLRETVTDCVFVIRSNSVRRPLWTYTELGAARVNGVVCPGFETAWRGKGIHFPITHYRGTGGPLLTTGMKAILREAYIAISNDLANYATDPGEARVVGRIWDAFQISSYYGVGQDVEVDGRLWVAIFAQQIGGFEYEPEASIFLALD